MATMFKSVKHAIRDLLRWSERYTQTDMVYVARGGFWLNLKQLSALAFSLGISIAFANLVPKEIYGTYRFVISIGGILGSLTLSGMNYAVARAVAQGFDGTFVRSLSVQIRWAWITIVISFASALYYFINANVVLGSALIAFGILYPISNTANTYSAFLHGKKDYFRTFWYGLGSSAFQFLVIVAAILLQPKVLALVIAYYFAQVVSNGYYLYRTIKIYRPTGTIDNSALGYGKHLSLMNLLSVTATQIDGVLVFHFLGPVQLAVYSFATIIPERIRSTFRFVSTIALPKLSQRPISRESLKFKVIRISVVAAGVAALYMILAPLVFRLALPKYIEAVAYSQVYGISLLAVALYLPSSALLAGANRRVLYSVTAITSTLQIILISGGLLVWGLWGAIIAKMLMQFFSLSLSYYLVASGRSVGEQAAV